jgi:hypothetical protein
VTGRTQEKIRRSIYLIERWRSKKRTKEDGREETRRENGYLKGGNTAAKPPGVIILI